MNVLLFSTLYPNSARPSHGIFVETRLAHLLASGAVSARVVAPIPYSANSRIVPAEYRGLGIVPYREERRGIAIVHPRFAVIPKIGMTVAPFLLYLGARKAVASLMREGFSFDLIDAHYFYPDGVAAAMLARALKKPLIITARGTDINLIPQYRLPRAMIRWAASEAGGIITVCAALRDALEALHVPAGKIRVLRNGVDLALFSPLDKAAARAALGLEGRVLLSVGHLIERKAHDLVIRALASLPGMRLVIAGDGPLAGELRGLASSLGVADRVRFAGSIAQRDLAKYYSSADLLVLASSREGWANVLLEAMACGTPVVASNVWGTPEVVAAPEAGLLLDARTPEAIARAVTSLLARPPSREAVRAYAERFSWDETTAGQIALFDEVLRGSGGPRRDPTPAPLMAPSS
jgi:teichuronic acid biosynthesis glycosyltransferase TuaC